MTKNIKRRKFIKMGAVASVGIPMGLAASQLAKTDKNNPIKIGVIGTGEKGKLPEDIKEEFRNAWSGIGKLLAECNISYDDIVEYTSYHVDLQANMGDFMSVRDEFLSEPWPAWTAIGITELAIPGARVEIRVMAKLKD